MGIGCLCMSKNMDVIRAAVFGGQQRNNFNKNLKGYCWGIAGNKTV